MTQISAKTVRESILAVDASLDPEFVRRNKEGIDNLINQMISTVRAIKQTDGQNQVENAARNDNYVDTPRSKKELDDEECARRVSAEINRGTSLEFILVLLFYHGFGIR